MALVDAAYPVRMGFAPRSVVIDDADHPGLLRAGPRASAPYGAGSVEHQVCDATDLVADHSVRPDLLDMGFDTVDLSGFEPIQQACADVLSAGWVTDQDSATIRASLDGALLRTSSGRSLRVLYLADEGFIMRTAGPNGMSVVGPRSAGMNGHGGATSVHADQDVFGTPVAQLMQGRAPSLFVHDSPDGHNHDASMLLVNLWIPLHQITQPLVLADGRSVDRRRHQLRYGLATGSFLDRDDDMAINDIWMFLHDEDQRWYFRSDMDHRSAYVFNTLSTPHGAGVLPGEDVAQWYFVALQAAESAAEAGDAAGVAEAVSPSGRPDLIGSVTPALRTAIVAMDRLLAEAREDPAAVAGGGRPDWVERSWIARRSVVRSSLEMRMVVTIEDGGSPTT